MNNNQPPDIIIHAPADKSVDHMAAAVLGAQAEHCAGVDMKKFMAALDSTGKLIARISDPSTLDDFVEVGPLAGKADHSMRFLLAVAMRNMTPRQFSKLTGASAVMSTALCSWLAQCLVAPGGEHLQAMFVGKEQ